MGWHGLLVELSVRKSWDEKAKEVVCLFCRIVERCQTIERGNPFGPQAGAMDKAYHARTPNCVHESRGHP